MRYLLCVPRAQPSKQHKGQPSRRPPPGPQVPITPPRPTAQEAACSHDAPSWQTEKPFPAGERSLPGCLSAIDFNVITAPPAPLLGWADTGVATPNRRQPSPAAESSDELHFYLFIWGVGRENHPLAHSLNAQWSWAGSGSQEQELPPGLPRPGATTRCLRGLCQEVELGIEPRPPIRGHRHLNW